ncbi:DUF6268 family outer membrane beta-barrel protein [Ascidiimonas sp. W6]|uniref:DUF6268 family outer membrane beta-barrel protein n=1 Tax=Ascidiimonas meishanensis TaxID=3128903 RepID=UPI0030EC5395
MKKFFLCIIFISLTYAIKAQINDLGGIEYTAFFGSKNDPFIGIAEIEMNIPIPLSKKEHYLVNGFSYSNVHVNYNSTYSFDSKQLDRFHILKYTLGYTFPLSKTWRFTAQITPSLASNFAAKVTTDDFVLNGSVILIRTIESPKKNRLTVGLAYNQTSGIAFPLPFITYFKEISPNLSYTVGVPITKMKYFFGDKKHAVESFVRLAGFFANLSNSISIGEEQAKQINLSAVVIGFGYDYYVGKRLNFFVKGGYLLRNELRLEENSSTEVFNFDLADTYYVRGGFKFNF